MKLRDWLVGPKSCVYAFVCHSKKRFLVGYTHDLLAAIYRLNKDIETPKYKLLKYDIEDIEIVIHKDNVEYDVNTKIEMGNIIETYKANGYELYIPSKFVRYSVHTDIMGYDNHVYFVVYLKTTRNDKVVVGLFRNEEHMKKFYNKYYTDGKVTGVYYSNNIYTNNHLKRYGYKVKGLSTEEKE
jgi:hypothetical protein